MMKREQQPALDQLLLDRMVDGELGGDERRELLLKCENQQQWRELALAYVESQTLRDDFMAFAQTDFSGLGATSESGETVETNETTQGNGSHDRSSDRSPSGRSMESGGVSWSPWALAAAVLLSLGLGYGAGWLQTPAARIVDRIPESPDNDVALGGAAQQGSGQESMQFTVSNPLTNELQLIDLPIVNASDLGPDWETRLHADERNHAGFVRKLRDQGWNMQQTRAVMPVRLQDGRRVIVPVTDYVERPFQ